VDRFTSNQDQNDPRPIQHISSNTFHQRKCCIFVKSVIILECRMSQRPSGRAPACSMTIIFYRSAWSVWSKTTSESRVNALLCTVNITSFRIKRGLERN